MKNENRIIRGDSMDVLPTLEEGSIDAVITDPPYGLSFMGKDWDRAVPSVEIWKECLRVLKPGAFAFVMCIPRQDCLAHMIINLGDAGFDVAFSSIYHTFANGFPKAQNLSKVADKRAGVKQEVTGWSIEPDGRCRVNEKTVFNDRKSWSKNAGFRDSEEKRQITAPVTPQAKALDGAYAGCQLKPAVEVVIVAMKPLSERTYIDQAIANGHGCTWLDECRIPYVTEKDATFEDRPNCSNKQYNTTCFQEGISKRVHNNKGRFPANVLCEDKVLDDGHITKSNGGEGTFFFKGIEARERFHYGDTGGFSRYFSLDAWFKDCIKSLPKEAQKTFPWLFVPKPSSSEKNRELNNAEKKDVPPAGLVGAIKKGTERPRKKRSNFHPTVKPIKLMSWLITLGTCEGDMVLDPFFGSGTTMIAAKMLGRYCIGIEKEKEYFDLATLRCNEFQKNINEYF